MPLMLLVCGGYVALYHRPASCKLGIAFALLADAKCLVELIMFLQFIGCSGCVDISLGIPQDRLRDGPASPFRY